MLFLVISQGNFLTASLIFNTFITTSCHSTKLQLRCDFPYIRLSSSVTISQWSFKLPLFARYFHVTRIYIKHSSTRWEKKERGKDTETSRIRRTWGGEKKRAAAATRGEQRSWTKFNFVKSLEGNFERRYFQAVASTNRVTSPIPSSCHG